MTDKQQKVVEAAKERLKKYSWFTGVCLDQLPDDARIDADFEGSVDLLVDDTAYWDGPGFSSLTEDNA